MILFVCLKGKGKDWRKYCPGFLEANSHQKSLNERCLCTHLHTLSLSPHVGSSTRAHNHIPTCVLAHSHPRAHSHTALLPVQSCTSTHTGREQMPAHTHNHTHMLTHIHNHTRAHTCSYYHIHVHMHDFLHIFMHRCTLTQCLHTHTYNHTPFHVCTCALAHSHMHNRVCKSHGHDRVCTCTLAHAYTTAVLLRTPFTFMLFCLLPGFPSRKLSALSTSCKHTAEVQTLFYYA
jgi:hypothetical protein